MQQQQQPGAGEEAELFDKRSVAENAKAISYVRTIMTIVGGFAAGILGLTGIKGLAFYAVLYVATSGLLLAKMGGNVASHVPKETTLGFLVNGMGGEALAYVLYWTLMYALVHIY